MDRRATMRQQMRDKILDAAVQLHTKNGILGTSWKDIAREADVSTATVYNHFATVDELVMACGDLLMQRLQPPAPEDAVDIIGAAKGTRPRLTRIVRALFDFYERAGSLMEIDLRERQLAAVREWEEYQRATVAAFVREALSEQTHPLTVVQTVTALVDYPTFKSLRSRGLSKRVAISTVVRLAVCLLGLDAEDVTKRD